MPKIFWKVFLWFWLTVLLAVFASFWLGDFWSERDRDSVQLAQLQSLAASAESIAEERGAQALRPWLRLMRHRTPFRILIIGPESGGSLRGRDLPPHLKAHLQFSADAAGVIESRFEGRKVISLPLHVADGRSYRLIGETRSPERVREFRIRFFKRLAEERMLIALVVTVLVCLLIAYWLVRPIRRMQQAARAFGEGDFTVRSGLEGRKDEIGDLAREFDGMAERIDSMIRAQQRLLRDVSHELRSPLARLRVALELARNRSGGTAVAELERIEHEACQIDSMIGDMLALVRLENGNEIPLDESIALDEMVSSIVKDANFEFAGSGKRADIAGLPSVAVKGNASLLRSAIENVVRNAMKYSADDSVVEVDMRHNGGESVCVEVRDFGSGIPEESLARVFDPFYRVGEARDRASGGFGLGLSIAARVVRSHGGSVRAENAAGGGLRVTISLPVRQTAV